MEKVKMLLLLISIFSFACYASTPTKGIDRTKITEEKMSKVFGKDYLSSLKGTDPDLVEMYERFTYGDLASRGVLSDKQRELISLVAITTNNLVDEVKMHVNGALNVGASPEEIKETLYQCAPYIGFPKVMAAVAKTNEVFKERGIPLPVKSQKTVTETTRYDEGLKIQVSTFGEGIRQSIVNAPDNQKHMFEYLSSFCFGDTYTRGTLTMKDRELITMCAIATLGGCEPQVKAHVRGNISVGNSKELLIDAITQMVPYNGWPRTLNALSCINEIVPENK